MSGKDNPGTGRDIVCEKGAGNSGRQESTKCLLTSIGVRRLQ